MHKITRIILKIFVLAAGLASLWFGFESLSVNTGNLLKTEAEVVSVSIVEGSSDEFFSDSFDVTYKYQVDNIQYEGYFSSSRDYSPGENLTVYYDPRSPETSDPSPEQSKFLGIILFLFGLYCIGGLGWGVLKTWLAMRNEEAIPTDNPNMDNG